jgi:hypothetical protein
MAVGMANKPNYIEKLIKVINGPRSNKTQKLIRILWVAAMSRE